MGVESSLNGTQIGLILIVLLAVTSFGLVGLKGLVSQSTVYLVSAFRLLTVLGLFLLVLRPFVIERDPDPKAFQVVVLGDVSGSMKTLDNKDDVSRLEKLKKVLNLEDSNSWLRRVREQFDIDVFTFSSGFKRFTPASWDDAGAGSSTALGEVLEEILNRDEKPLGAVVAITDGNNNRGQGIIEAAKRYKQSGVPINIIGIGKEFKGGDLKVRFLEDELRTVAKEKVELRAVVKNTFNHEIETKATLWEGNTSVQSVPIKLASGKEEAVRFSVTHQTRGMRSYKVSIDAPDRDADASSDSDQLTVVVQAPDKLKVLYISDKLQLNYRFIKQSLAYDERFEFFSLIDFGEERFYRFGKSLPNAYPKDPMFWHDFEAIIMASGVVGKLEQPVVDGLKSFVARRGGGLLLFGGDAAARERLGGIVPVKRVEELIEREDRRLFLSPEPVFTAEYDLEAMRLYLPKDLPNWVALEHNRASRLVVFKGNQGNPFMLAQAYGAGRVGYWGVEHDWAWVMASDRGRKDHVSFWHALAEWLGAGGVDRLNFDFGDRLFDVESPIDLGVEVLGADFEPSANAIVEAVVTKPDGEEKQIQLLPDTTQFGFYKGEYFAREMGDYTIKYRAILREDEVLEQDAMVAVTGSSSEYNDTSFQSALLEDVARFTGGIYQHVDNPFLSDEIALASLLPMREKRHFPTEHPLFLICLIGIAGSEWLIRRQAGLK